MGSPKSPLCAGPRELMRTKGPPPTQQARERRPGTKNFLAGEGARWWKASGFLGGIHWASGDGAVQPERWLRARLPAPLCPAPGSLTWGQVNGAFQTEPGSEETLLWGWVASLGDLALS